MPIRQAILERRRRTRHRQKNGMQTREKEKSRKGVGLGIQKRKPNRDIEFVCLGCTLPICDEKQKQCLYTIQRTATARDKERKQKARKTVSARNEREAQEIKTGLIFILTELIAQRDRDGSDKSFAG